MKSLKAIVCAAGAALGLVVASTGALAQVVDVDTDGDGLSDFQEIHKYFTDPTKADSDGDGIPDGDWNERREYAYTVRTITQVLKPVTRDVLQDDYQDARVLDETETYVELEVVMYPLNTVASGICADPGYRQNNAPMVQWILPGPTANWDQAMQEAMVRDIAAAGIDLRNLSDKELVEKASPWLLKHAKYQDGFSTFCSTFKDGKVQLYPGLEAAAMKEAAKSTMSVQEQWERELFAKGMYEHAVRGSCTSSAIYMNGCLRALGIPTRIVLCIPIIDGTDSSERAMVDGLRNHVVWSTVSQGTAHLSQGWSSHTYNEVFVGGRWRRLNYDRLGQNIMDPNYFGMMIHVATFSDWADGNMSATWGVRELAEETPRDVFGGANPYSTLGISERWGVHASKANPVPEGEFGALTIDKAVWLADRPEGLEISNPQDPQTAGHIFVHVEESRKDKQASQYRCFFRAVDKRFVLCAPGKADVPLKAERGCWVDTEKGIQHFYLRIAPEAFKTMEAGVAYTLATAPGGSGGDESGCTWTVRPGVTLTKPEGAGVIPTPATVTIKKAFWSDATKDTAMVLQELGPSVLIDVGPDKDFAAFKRFCEAADLEFVLEAPGHPPVRATAVVGGVTLADESHGVLVIEGDSWKDLVLGVGYTIRPVNSVQEHRWVVADGVTCTRK